MQEKLYPAIDLGTTNSAISCGRVVGENKFDANICNVTRIGKEGGMEAKPTLPSVVYYQINPKTGEKVTIVGDYAKNQYGKKYRSVVKSVKNYMGSSVPVALDEKIGDKYPEEVSSEILKHLLLGLKDKLNLSEIPKNAVITIPASFDSDQCNATLRAAEKAGLDIKDEKGEYRRGILLDEPKAVIYNIANMIASGEISKNTVDFSEKKNVLVFDLGGGTLDVALYSVCNNRSLNFPIIDELAIGRYTRIGGDDFDKLLSKHLVEEFLDYSGLSRSEVNIQELTEIMESRAEYVKFELSEKVFNSKFSGNVVSDDQEFDIFEMELYKGFGFEASLRKIEVENILAPLMGHHLKKEDVSRINRFTSEKDIENIIYPILDVLAKAKDNGYSTDVDAIILNGGMTKFYLIQDRLEKFFDKKPITVNDPDLAVAKGASYYQYCLEKIDMANIINDTSKKRDKIVSSAPKKSTVLKLGNVIVNDDINLGLEKGRVTKLVKAGTKLPTGNIKVEPLHLPVGTDRIELPIYLGRGKTTDAPNRKIVNRILTLKKNYSPGTPVNLEVSIDENKVLQITGYVGQNKSEKIDITVDTGEAVTQNRKANKISSSNYDDINPGTEIETLKVNIQKMETIQAQTRGKKMHPVQEKKYKDAKHKIFEVISAVKGCNNKQSFERKILENLRKSGNKDSLKGILIDLGANIYPYMTKQGQEEFASICRGCVNRNAMLNFQNQSVITKAIIALGDIGDKRSRNDLELIVGEGYAKNYKLNIVRTLGKLSGDNDFIVNNFLSVSDDSREIPYWMYAVGKTFSRNISTRTDKTVEKVANKILKLLLMEKAKEVALVALGEICSSLDDVEYKLEEKFIKKIETEVSKYIKTCREEKYRNKVRLIHNVILGLKLTNEESNAEYWWNTL